MHPKYTNVKYVFLSIKIYEKHDFKGSQAKLAAYTWFFIYYVIPTSKQKRSACTRAVSSNYCIQQLLASLSALTQMGATLEITIRKMFISVNKAAAFRHRGSHLVTIETPGCRRHTWYREGGAALSPGCRQASTSGRLSKEFPVWDGSVLCWSSATETNRCQIHQQINSI